MIWTVTAPHDAEVLGLLPEIFTDSDPRPAAEQANDRYAHGGGWRPQSGWEIDLNNGEAGFPGDPPLTPIAWVEMNGELLTLYPYAYVAIVQPDGSFEMARMD